MKPIDTAGKAIAEILRLADENKQLKNDLEVMTLSRDATLKIFESHVNSMNRLVKEWKDKEQDYCMLSVLILWIWIWFIGLVING